MTGRQTTLEEVLRTHGGIQSVPGWQPPPEPEPPAPPVFLYYPSWRYYHAQFAGMHKKPVIVQNADEDVALGPHWFPYPSKF